MMISEVSDGKASICGGVQARSSEPARQCRRLRVV